MIWRIGRTSPNGVADEEENKKEKKRTTPSRKREILPRRPPKKKRKGRVGSLGKRRGKEIKKEGKKELGSQEFYFSHSPERDPRGKKPSWSHRKAIIKKKECNFQQRDREKKIEKMGKKTGPAPKGKNEEKKIVN